MKKILGRHYLVEYTGCAPERISDVSRVRPALLQAAKESGTTILESVFHQFTPAGVSGVVLIAESHLAVHTWPEDGYVSFDVQTCGDMDALAAVEWLKNEFAAEGMTVKMHERGF